MADVKVSFLICSNRGRGTITKALESVARQQHKNLWECVLVDNGFTCEDAFVIKESTAKLFLPGNWRMIQEEKPGLGYARRAGFAAANGEWIVMLDDDNYVAEDFVSNLISLLAVFPMIGGISPFVYPILPKPEMAWHRSVANRCLSVTEDAIRALGEVPQFFGGAEARLAPRPPGGGMIVRREVAELWSIASASRGTMFLERTGSSLIAAGDEEIWRTLLAMGLSVVVTDRLRIAHDLPNDRFGWRYLWRLNYWMAWSYAWLDVEDGAFGGTSGWLPRWIQSIRHLKLILLASGKEARLTRWMDWSSALGRWSGHRAAQVKRNAPFAGRVIDSAHRSSVEQVETP